VRQLTCEVTHLLKAHQHQFKNLSVRMQVILCTTRRQFTLEEFRSPGSEAGAGAQPFRQYCSATLLANMSEGEMQAVKRVPLTPVLVAKETHIHTSISEEY
jgi:hypothetical protein